MLYDGCLRFMTNADQAMQRKDIFSQNQNCQRAQNIITELISTLDMNRGGEIATNLYQLYNYAYDQLIMANINDDQVALKQSMKVFEELRQSLVRTRTTNSDWNRPRHNPKCSLTKTISS